MYLVCVCVFILGVTNNVVISQEIALPTEGKDRGPSVQEIVWELGKFIKEYIEKYCDKPFNPALLLNTAKNYEHPVYVKSLSEPTESEETLVIRRNYANRLEPKNDLTEPAFRRSALNESDIEEEPLTDEEKDSILLEIEDQPKDSKSVLTAEELILNINGPEGMRRSSVTLPKDLQTLISTYLKQRKRRQKKRIKVSINSRVSVSSGSKNVQYRRAHDAGEGNDVLVEELPESYEVPDQNTVFEDDEVVRRFFLVPKDDAHHFKKKFLPDLSTLLADKVHHIISKPIQKLGPTKELPGFNKHVQYQYEPGNVKQFSMPYGSLQDKPPPVIYYAQQYGVPGQNTPGQADNPYGSLKLFTESKQPEVQYNVQANKPYGSIKLSTESQPYDPKVQYNVYKFQVPAQTNKPYDSFKLSTDNKQPEVQYNVQQYELPGQATKPYGSFKLSTGNQPYDPKVQNNVQQYEVPGQANKPYGSFKLSIDSKQPEVQYNVQQYGASGQADNPYGSLKLFTESKQPEIQYNVQQYRVPGQANKPYGSIKLSTENQPYGPKVQYNVPNFEIPGQANKPYGSVKVSTENQPYDPKVQYNVHKFEVPGQNKYPYGSVQLSGTGQPYGSDLINKVYQYKLPGQNTPGQANNPYGSLRLSTENQPSDPKVQYNVHKFEIPVQVNKPYGSIKLSTENKPYDPKVQYKVYQYEIPGQITPGQIKNPYGTLELSADGTKKPYGSDITYNVQQYEIPLQKNSNPMKLIQDFLNLQHQPVHIGLNQEPVQVGLNQQPMQVYTQYKPVDNSSPQNNQYGYAYQITPVVDDSKTKLYYPDQAYPTEYPYYIYTKHPKSHTHKDGHKKPLTPTAEHDKPTKGLYSKILVDKILHKHPKHMDKKIRKNQKFYNMPQNEKEESDEEYAMRRFNAPVPTVINPIQPPLETMLENGNGNLTDEAKQKLLASVMSKIAEEFENGVQPIPLENTPIDEGQRDEVFRRAMTQIAEEFDQDMAEHQPVPLENPPIEEDQRQEVFRRAMTQIEEEFDKDMAEHQTVQPVPLENPPIEQEERQEVLRRAMAQIAEEFDKDMTELPPLENAPIEEDQKQEVLRKAMAQIAEEFDKDVAKQDEQPPTLENPPIEEQRQEVFRRAMTQIAEEFDKDMTERPPLEKAPTEEDQRQQVLSKAMTQIAQEFDKQPSVGQKHPKKDIEEVYTRAMSEIEKEFEKGMAINKPKQSSGVRAGSQKSPKSSEEGFVYGKSDESTDQIKSNENNDSSDLSDDCDETSDINNEDNSAQTPENQGDRRNCTETQSDKTRNYQASSTSEKPKSAVQWGVNLIKGMFGSDNGTQNEQADDEESGKVKEQVMEINMTEVRRFSKRPDTFTSSVGVEDFHQSDSSSNESSTSSELFGNDLTKKNEASNDGSILSVIGNLFRPAEVERSSFKATGAAGDGMDADNVTMYYSQVTYNHEKDTDSFPKSNVASQVKSSTESKNDPSQLNEGINEKWEDNEKIKINPDETVGENLETGDFVSQDTTTEEENLRHNGQGGIEISHEPSSNTDSTLSTFIPETVEQVATESVDTVTFIDLPTSATSEEIQTIADMGKDIDYNLYYGTEDPGSYITERTTTVSTNVEATTGSEEDVNYDQESITNLEDTALDREERTTILEDTNLEREDGTTTLEDTNLEREDITRTLEDTNLEHEDSPTTLDDTNVHDEYETATDEELFYGNKEYEEHNTVVPQRRNRGRQSEEIIEDIESHPSYKNGIIFLKHKLMFEPYTDNGKYENYITKNILEKPLDKLNDTEKLIFHRLVSLAKHPDDLVSKYAPNEYSPLNSTDNKFFLRGSLYDSLLDNDYLRKGVILLKNYPFKRKLEYSKSSPELKRLLRDFEMEKKTPNSEEKRINLVLPLLASNPEELDKVYNAIVKLNGEPDKNELAMGEQWAQRLQNETGFMYTDQYNKGLELMYLYLGDHQNDGKPEEDFRKFLIKLLFKKQPDEDLSEEEQTVLDSLTFVYKKSLKKPLDKEEQEIVDDSLYKFGIIILYNSPNKENLGLMGNELLESVMKKPDTELNDREYKIYNNLMKLAKNPEELQKRYYNVMTSVNGEIENDTNDTLSQGVKFLKEYYISNKGKPTSPEEISTLLIDNVMKKSPAEFTKRDQYVFDILMYISQNMQLLEDFGNSEDYMVYNDVLYKTGIITIYNSPNRNNSELLAEEILQTVIKKPKTELSFIERKVYEYLMDIAKHPEILVENYNNIMVDAKDITLAEDAEEEDKEIKNKYEDKEKNKYMIALIKIPNKALGENGDDIMNKTIKIVIDDLHQKITDMSGEPVSCEKMVFIMPEEHSKPLEPMNIDEEANLVHQLEYVRAQLKMNHALPGVFREEEITERLDDIILYLIRMLQSGFSSSVTETDKIVYDLNVIESGEDSHELLGRIILLIKKRKTNRKEVDDVELVECLTTLQRQLIKRIKSYYGTTDFKHKPVEIERRFLTGHNADLTGSPIGQIGIEQPGTEERVASNLPGEENEEALPLEKAQRRSFFSDDQSYEEDDTPRGQRRGLMDTPMKMAMDVIGKWFAAQNTMQPPPDTYRRFVQDSQNQNFQEDDAPRGQRRGLMDTPMQMAMDVIGKWFAAQNTLQPPPETSRRFVQDQQRDVYSQDQNYQENELPTAQRRGLMDTPIQMAMNVIGKWFAAQNTMQPPPNSYRRFAEQDGSKSSLETSEDSESVDSEYFRSDNYDDNIEGKDTADKDGTTVPKADQSLKQTMTDSPITRIIGLANTDGDLRKRYGQDIKMEDTPITGLESTVGEIKQPEKNLHMNREWTIKSIEHTRPRDRKERLKKRQSEEIIVTDDDDNDDSIQLMTMRRGYSPTFMKQLEETIEKRKRKILQAKDAENPKMQQAEDEENPKMQHAEDEENPINIVQPSRRFFPLNMLSTITNFLPIGGAQGGLGGLGNPLQMLGQLNPLQLLGGGTRRSDMTSQQDENKYATQDRSVPGRDNTRLVPEMNNRQNYNDEIQNYVYYTRLQQGNPQEQQDFRETTQQNDPLGTPPHPEGGHTSTTELSSIIYSTDN